MLAPEVTDDELSRLTKAGVRGVRFNFVKRLVDSTPREVFYALAERVKAFGWHVVVYFEAPDLADLRPFLEELAREQIVVIDTWADRMSPQAQMAASLISSLH